ncbi:response regulator transcription factor [Terrabacter carboxydivorans]|uniref:HTH luxR-type domain-containing protein n=1 Tax=Terrabacter carboxydivorans TaxID=619730 RepID=A0ABN3KSI7_9MICO
MPPTLATTADTWRPQRRPSPTRAPTKQIAHSLFVSVRTVESHVRSALAKLGFSTRTELALWVRHRSRG